MLTISPSRDLGYLLGAAEYLMKPIDPTLAGLLAKYQLLHTGRRGLVVDDDEATP